MHPTRAGWHPLGGGWQARRDEAEGDARNTMPAVISGGHSLSRISPRSTAHAPRPFDRRWDDATGSNLYEHLGGVNDLRLASATFAATRVPLSLAAAGRSSLLTAPQFLVGMAGGSADMRARPSSSSTATASVTPS